MVWNEEISAGIERFFQKSLDNVNQLVNFAPYSNEKRI